MSSVWDSKDVKNLEKNIKKNFINGYNGQTEVNTRDKRLTSIDKERNRTINQSNEEYNQRINQNRADYNNMISSTDQYYNQINDSLNEGLQKQQDAMNAQTEATVDKINTEKEKTNRDYLNEQKGSYIDYRNATNPYGANAEQMASNGLWGSGYSETYRSNAYNTWQNRVAIARQSFNDTMTSYDQQITDALNSNNTAQAELWSKVALQIAQNSLQGFQYKNTLIESRNTQENNLIQARNSREDTLNSRYDTKYQNTWENMSTDLNRKISNYQWGQSYLSNIAKERQSYKEWLAEYNQKKAYYAAQLRQSQAQLAETKRHNKASEALSRASLNKSRSLTSGSQKKTSSGKSRSLKSSPPKSKNKPTSPKDVIKNMKVLQGPLIKNNIADGYSGKTFSSPKALLAYYGYGVK